MTVKELIEQLQQMPQNALVVSEYYGYQDDGNVAIINFVGKVEFLGDTAVEISV